MIKKAFSLSEFFRLEAAGGVVLVIASALAMIVANSPLYPLYDNILNERHVLHWINDGLMAVFFFMVGLEIKREMVEGSLSSIRQATLPVLAALGGMIVPALIFI